MAIDPKCLKLHLVDSNQWRCTSLSLMTSNQRSVVNPGGPETPVAPQLDPSKPSEESSYATPIPFKIDTSRPTPWAYLDVLGVVNRAFWRNTPSVGQAQPDNFTSEGLLPRPGPLANLIRNISPKEIAFLPGQSGAIGGNLYLNTQPQYSKVMGTITFYLF